MSIRTAQWDLLLDRLPLRETLDNLRGYDFPPAAREALCEKHALDEQQLEGILKIHRTLYQPIRIKGGKRGPTRPFGPRLRDGMDLLLDNAELRSEIARAPLSSLLTAWALQRLQLVYKLRPLEVSRVLNAHAEMLTRH